MRLLARALSLGRFSIVEEWAAADLVIAEAATIDLVHWSSLAGAAASFLPNLEPVEDTSPLPDLEGRQLCRERKERLPMAAGSSDMTPSMTGAYDFASLQSAYQRCDQETLEGLGPPYRGRIFLPCKEQKVLCIHSKYVLWNLWLLYALFEQ